MGINLELSYMNVAYNETNDKSTQRKFCETVMTNFRNFLSYNFGIFKFCLRNI